MKYMWLSMGRAERKPQRHFQRYNQGVTLVEMMIVVVILGIVASIAVPSFNSYFERERVKRAAEDIYGLVLQAKSEGPIRDTDMWIAVNTGAWCVGFSDSANCACAANGCTLSVAGVDVTNVVSGTEHPGVTISGFTGTRFDRLRGTATAGNINVSSGGYSLRIEISPEGRLRLCNPNGDSTGYEQC